MILDPQQKLTISLSRTSDGQHDYLQILSGDQFALNIVLVAKSIDIVDQRPPKKGKA